MNALGVDLVTLSTRRNVIFSKYSSDLCWFLAVATTVSLDSIGRAGMVYRPSGLKDQKARVRRRNRRINLQTEFSAVWEGLAAFLRVPSFDFAASRRRIAR
jgi:hypothetical protein